MNILTDIVERKKAEVAARQRKIPLAALQAYGLQSVGLPPRRSFRSALKTPDLSVIAEIKRRSPSKGELRCDIDVAQVARSYAANHASAISVLTDETFFGGSHDDLVSARDSVNLPVLQKDFIIDPYQLHEARSIGADAVLLIVRILGRQRLGELLGIAAELTLDALVEVHTAEELAQALEAGAGIIGVNNRNLDTFDVSLQTAVDLRPLIPPGCIAVAESGIVDRDAFL